MTPPEELAHAGTALPGQPPAVPPIAVEIVAEDAQRPVKFIIGQLLKGVEHAV
jgi:hypothetical protein